MKGPMRDSSRIILGTATCDTQVATRVRRRGGLRGCGISEEEGADMSYLIECYVLSGAVSVNNFNH